MSIFTDSRAATVNGVKRGDRGTCDSMRRVCGGLAYFQPVDGLDVRGLWAKVAR